MRKLTLVVALLFATAAVAQTKIPVLVELFTSEGCSSCPPADQLLIQLDKDQPVPDADIIPLSEHVTYWDGHGWNDRFDSPEFTLRQQAYAERFHIDGPYTPEMVVDGDSQFVGNDPNLALNAIRNEIRDRRALPDISLQRSGNRLAVDVAGAGSKHQDVFYAITESNLTTRVGGGENHGRVLHHTAVVREFKKIGSTRNGRFDKTLPLHLNSHWNPANLRAVVFLQDGSTGHIASAAELSLGDIH